MSWKDDPKIRELEPYAKKHGYLTIVLFAVHEGAEQYNITTYGRDAKLCKAAAVAGGQLHELVQAGTWPNWPEDEPEFTRQDSLAAENEALTTDRDRWFRHGHSPQHAAYGQANRRVGLLLRRLAGEDPRGRRGGGSDETGHDPC